MLWGVPSIAVSLVSFDACHYETAQWAAETIASFVLEKGLPADVMLNVNLPDLPLDRISGIEVTSLGRRNYHDEIVERKDPRSGTYYWIGGSEPGHYKSPGSDFEAIGENRVSVTPLRRDSTQHDFLDRLRHDLSVSVDHDPKVTALQ